MSEQALDLRRSLHIVREHVIAVGAVALVGLIAGAGYSIVRPPMLSSTALVVLSPATKDVPTQVVIADSEPVLAGALRRIHPALTWQALRNQVQVRNMTSDIISISARAKTAAQAEDIANAVAASYVGYVSPARAAREVQAQVRPLQSATTATGTKPSVQLAISALIGAAAGALIGAIGVLAISRRDRRLRNRDDIANAIGVPVLASIPVEHPSDARRWVRLLEQYQPSVVHGWQLRSALRYLGQADIVMASASNGDSLSVAVLSLSSDQDAVALGPQLAVFAASLGIPTALVIGSQQDAKALAALRAACADPPRSPQWPARLQVTAADHDDLTRRPPGARLTVVVSVLDDREPQVADTMRTSATLLGVSAGAVTAAQLAAVAVSAAADGRQIDGLLVADPDPADHTTGRIPQLARPTQPRMPTRLTGIPTETRQ
jgi:capsular polysaccharide biosynthesis protein